LLLEKINFLLNMLYHKTKRIKDFFSNNWLTIVLVVVAFLGGAVGSTAISRANILNDIYKNIVGGLNSLNSITSTSSPLILGKDQEKKDGFQSKSVQVINDYEQAIINAVQKASPAVVSIVISKDVPIIEQCPYNPFSDLPEEFRQFFDFGDGFQFYQPCSKGKTKKKEVGGGSGFLITSDGLIITNKHVVSDTDADYTVFTNDGKKYSAKVLARHPSLDLAVVKISGNNFPTVEIGSSANLKLGQTTIAIGNALGEYRNTVSVGVVSGLARTITASDSLGHAETINNVIQTSAAINPGNSGGPLLNLSGQVIGINVAMVSGAQNIAFAIPIDAAKKTIESVKSSGQIRVAYLGVRYIMLNPEIAQKYKLSQTSGALVKGDENNFAVEKNSPADKAGIKEGDIITKIDDQVLDQNNSLGLVISQKNPGDVVALTIIRDGKEMVINVTLGERK
jgi:serine protease Do